MGVIPPISVVALHILVRAYERRCTTAARLLRVSEQVLRLGTHATLSYRLALEKPQSSLWRASGSAVSHGC